MSNYPIIDKEKEKVVISSGQSESSSIQSLGRVLTNIDFPADFDGTAITFKEKSEDDTFKTYVDAAGENVSVTVSRNKIVGLLPADFSGLKTFRLVSDATETAERTIYLTFRPVS